MLTAQYSNPTKDLVVEESIELFGSGGAMKGDGQAVKLKHASKAWFFKDSATTVLNWDANGLYYMLTDANHSNPNWLSRAKMVKIANSMSY